MPVNFATDLRDLKDYGYVQQIPLDALFKNLGYKQQKYDAGAQKMQSAADSLLVNAYGQDVEKRNQIVNQINQQLQQFTGMDLSDPKVQNQVNSFISQVGSSPDLAGIKMRADSYDRVQAKKQKLLADGKGTISPWNDGTSDMEDYYSGNQAYNPHKRFTGDVRLDTDLDAFSKQVAEATPVLEQMKKEGRYDITTQGKVRSQLETNYKTNALNNEAVKNELYGRFKSQYHPDHSFANEDAQLEQQHQQSALEAHNQYSLALEREQNKEKPDPNLINNYRQKIAQAEQLYGESQDHMHNLSESGSEQAAFERYLNNQASTFADGHVSYATKSITPDKFAEMDQQLKNDLVKISAEGDKQIKVNAAKGLGMDNDATSANAILNTHRDLLNGKFDSEANLPTYWGASSTNKSELSPDDFKDLYDIKAGISGNWKPVQNLPYLNDLFGVKTVTKQTSQSGDLETTGGKQIVGAFRQGTGPTSKLMVVVDEGGSKHTEVITNDEIKDRVAKTLHGKNFSENQASIYGYDFDTGSSTKSTTTNTGKIVSTGVSYNPTDSTTTFHFK